MSAHKKTSITLFVIADIIIAFVSTLMPFVFRFGIFSFWGPVSSPYLVKALQMFPLDAAILVAVNSILKLYNRVWTYASVDEMYDCIKSAVVTEAIYIAYKYILGIYMFRSYYPFNFLTMLLLLGMSRGAVRFIRGVERRRNKKGNQHRVMLIGGGSAANLLLKEYQVSGRNIHVPCIVDDNPDKKGKKLLNVPIIGAKCILGTT